MMTKSSAETESLITLVEAAARFRGNPPVARDFITEALQKIAGGERRVGTYPTGRPSLRDVYLYARELQLSKTVTE